MPPPRRRCHRALPAHPSYAAPAGYNFDGAKAYKDSKLCLMMTSNLLHDKYYKQTGIAFSSIYPG